MRNVALDESAPPRIRAAVSAVWSLTKEKETLVRPLRELTQGEIDSDPHEDIRAASIEALWPDHLTTVEVLDMLTPPRTPNFHGDYAALSFTLPCRFMSRALQPT